jgi:chromosome segregation ATPase
MGQTNRAAESTGAADTSGMESDEMAGHPGGVVAAERRQSSTSERRTSALKEEGADQAEERTADADAAMDESDAVDSDVSMSDAGDNDTGDEGAQDRGEEAPYDAATAGDGALQALRDEIASLQQALADASDSFATERGDFQSKTSAMQVRVQAQARLPLQPLNSPFFWLYPSFPNRTHPFFNAQAELKELRASSSAAVASAEAKAAELTVALEGRAAELARGEAALTEAEDKVAKLQEERLASVDMDTAAEIRALMADVETKRNAVRETEKALGETRTHAKQLEARAAQLHEQVASLESASSSQSTESSEAQAAAMAEIAGLKSELAKSSAAAHAAKAQEKALTALQAQLASANGAVEKLRAEQRKAGKSGGTTAAAAAGGAASGADARKLQKQLDKANREIEKLTSRLEMSGGGGAGAGPDLQRMDKKLKDAEKRVAAYKAQDQKSKEKIAALAASVAEKEKAIAAAQSETRQVRTELKDAEASAAESIAIMEEYKTLKGETKKLQKENAVLQENFNSERVLRKKYYNMMEDMKGKVRVYCRVRPLSGSEKERGNHEVVTAPDEYTLVVSDGNRHEEFGFDSVFMPDSSQGQVYEDTGNLVQSAVDGFNVCIFAYGQTGVWLGLLRVGLSGPSFAVVFALLLFI